MTSAAPRAARLRTVFSSFFVRISVHQLSDAAGIRAAAGLAEPQ
jgi:hypothetical protein